MGAKIPASAGAAGLVLDAGQHRAGELVGDRVHVQLVPAAAVEEQRVAAAADEPEARLLVGDVAQAQGVKGAAVGSRRPLCLSMSSIQAPSVPAS
jgi:hypothetical protein